MGQFSPTDFFSTQTYAIFFRQELFDFAYEIHLTEFVPVPQYFWLSRYTFTCMVKGI